jgi:signal transduction histidine kinase
MTSRKVPLWLKLFVFAAAILIPTVSALVISLNNSTRFLADLSINNEIEAGLRSNLEAMQHLKRVARGDELRELEQKFSQHQETYQAYSSLKEIKGQLINEFYRHAVIVGFVALIISFVAAGLLASNILAIFESISQKLREKDRLQAIMGSLENWQEVSKSVIHELKGSLMPLKLITSASGDQRGHNTEASKQVILTEINKMESLIDELTGFARLPKPNFTEENLISTLEYAIKNFRFEGLRARLESNLPNESPVLGRHDPNMIHRLVFNLMKNALEANNGYVNLNITIEATIENVLIHVEDDGIGINSKMIGDIFDPGVTLKPKLQVEDMIQPLSTNLGIGLAISKKIALDHGGDLVALPSKKGAHFLFSIPRIG